MTRPTRVPVTKMYFSTQCCRWFQPPGPVADDRAYVRESLLHQQYGGGGTRVVDDARVVVDVINLTVKSRLKGTANAMFLANFTLIIGPALSHHHHHNTDRYSG